jgi:hypothetical protein
MMLWGVTPWARANAALQSSVKTRAGLKNGWNDGTGKFGLLVERLPCPDGCPKISIFETGSRQNRLCVIISLVSRLTRPERGL